MFIPDEGYYFGLGAFETIAVENGVPQFLPQHYKRLKAALKFLSLDTDFSEIEEKARLALTQKEMQEGRKVLKITVSKENIFITTRANTYQKEDYEKGFFTAISNVKRNETSPFTYHKTLNYGDCIMEKRHAKEMGIQEPIFLNTRGEIAEGATTNVFFVKDGQIIAPPLCCGMLPGIIREYLYDAYTIEEQIILPEDIGEFDEMFLTNSLLGIMPVARLGSHTFSDMSAGRKLLRELSNSQCGFC